MTQEIVDIIIIGGGPVGLFTAFYAGLRQASVKIIETLPQLGGQPGMLYPEKMVYDIPAFPEITAGGFNRELEKNSSNVSQKLSFARRRSARIKQNRFRV